MLRGQHGHHGHCEHALRVQERVHWQCERDLLQDLRFRSVRLPLSCPAHPATFGVGYQKQSELSKTDLIVTAGILSPASQVPLSLQQLPVSKLLHLILSKYSEAGFEKVGFAAACSDLQQRPTDCFSYS